MSGAGATAAGRARERAGLVATDLAYGWHERTIGAGLSLRLSPGRLTFLLGANGAGKTTLVRTLLGLAPAMAGRIALDGEPIEALSRRAIAQRIAWVPQAGDPYFPYTAMQSVLMGRAAHLGTLAAPGAADAAIARAALERLGIARLGATPVTRLSGGERQLVRIARALAQQACTLVLDEPTASLDLGNAQRVLATMRALADDGHAVLATTHDPNEALAYGDEAWLMQHGAIVAQGAPAAVITESRLADLYGVLARLVSAGDGRLACVLGTQIVQPASAAGPLLPTGTGGGIR